MLGLVNQVVAPEELLATTYEYARNLATEIADLAGGHQVAAVPGSPRRRRLVGA